MMLSNAMEPQMRMRMPGEPVGRESGGEGYPITRCSGCVERLEPEAGCFHARRLERHSQCELTVRGDARVRARVIVARREEPAGDGLLARVGERELDRGQRLIEVRAVAQRRV